MKYFLKVTCDNNLFFRVVTRLLYNIYKDYIERKMLRD